MDLNLNLTGRVGPGESAKAGDMTSTKNALTMTGDYRPPAGAFNSAYDRELEDAIRRFQRRNSLWPDATIRPGGPTQSLINAELREKRSGRPAKGQGLGLGNSVGDGQSNRTGDVVRVSTALGHLGYLDTSANAGAVPLLAPDPDFGSGLRMMQRDYNLKPDGLLHPGGPTDQMLARAAGPLPFDAEPVVQTGSTDRERARPLSASPVSARRRSSRPGRKRSHPHTRPNRWDEITDAVGEHLFGTPGERLRVVSRVGRALGLEHAADNLDHYLDGKGADQWHTREQARQRGPVIRGEAKNQKRFLDAFMTSRLDRSPLGGKNSNAEYLSHLLSLKDGEGIRVPPGSGEVGEPRDHWDVNSRQRDHVMALDPDELVATGRSSFTSRAWDGFQARREGDLITIEGVVEHEWNDKYDFGKESLSSELAVAAAESGEAQVYDNKAGWTQKLTATFRVVDNKLVPVSHKWTDLEDYAEKDR